MNLVTFEQLKQWSGYKGKGQVRKWLERNGIAHTIGKSGAPITTQEAIERRITGAKNHEHQGEKIEFA